MSIVACGNAAPDSGFGNPNGAGGNGFGDGNQGSSGTLGNGNTSKPADDLAACATATATAEGKPVYLVFAYDKSGSMDKNGKWDAAKAAMKGFFSSPDAKGVSASITFFPTDTSNYCGVSRYSSPQVAVTALPSASFGSALDGTGPNGGTPTADALGGAIAYAQTLQAGQGKDGTVAVVMVTDGVPEGCADDLDVQPSVDEATAVAATIKTYIVGVGDQLSNLNAIAVAGGTKSAFVVSVGDPSKTQTDLTNAINTIRLSALACDYKIPAPPSGQTFDRSKVNVQVTPEGGSATALDYNPSCSGGKGWRYDDPNAPTRVLACDATCNDLKAKPGKVDIVFGCETKTGPVK
jgi:hypothetical protein